MLNPRPQWPAWISIGLKIGLKVIYKSIIKIHVKNHKCTILLFIQINTPEADSWTLFKCENTTMYVISMSHGPLVT